MIIAGPGTGKTRTLTSRIAASVASGEIRPQSCLALTFTRRAAEEMRARLAGALGRRAARITVTTFHGLGLLLLREHHQLAGLPPDVAVADEATVTQVAAELAGSPRAGRALLAAGQDRQPVRRVLAERGLVDLAGLVELPAALLAGQPALAAGLRERWPRLSVDEYQDIDATQYALLRLLAGDGAGLTVIGDPDQAIYGFRGADVEFFLRFTADYPAAATVTLSTNYRSSPVIVTAATQAIAPSSLVPGRLLRAATPAPATGPGHRGPGTPAPSLARAGPGTRGRSSSTRRRTRPARRPGSPRPSTGCWADPRSTPWTAGGLTVTVNRGSAWPTSPCSTGPMPRRRRWARGWPGPGCRSRSGRMTCCRAARESLRSCMSCDCVTHPAVPAGRPGRPGGPDVPARLRAAVHRLAAAAGPGRLTAADLRTAGEVLAPLARRCEDDLDRFCTDIALGAEVDALDPRADAISLLTLHAAKGLEFEVVFLAGCERGLLPLRLPGAPPGTGPDQAEERRLLFVGLTRARRHLLLSCAAERSRPGRTGPAGPSPFLAAIDPALLDRSAPPRARRPASRQLRLL